MPATDPINPNVHPLIYRWNGIFGQSQAAALEAAGKRGLTREQHFAPGSILRVDVDTRHPIGYEWPRPRTGSM